MLDAPVDTLPGLGPAAARSLATQGVRDVGDLLQSPPRSLVDLRAPLSGQGIFEALAAAPRAIRAIRGVVEKASVIPLRGRRAVRVAMRSDDVAIELWWFFLSPAARALTGEIIAVGIASPIAKRPAALRMAHPRIVSADKLGTLTPIYGFTGAPSARIEAAISAALDRVDPAPLDPWPAELRAREHAPPIDDVLRAVHRPTDPAAHAAAQASLRARLAWAEACWLVLRRLERERAMDATTAPRLPLDPAARERLIAALGFEPTGAQARAIEVIGLQLDAKRPARTLLTGDVGTGKTAVLLAAAAQAVAAKRQVAILAPTTVLAEQYLDAAGPLATALGARIALLPSQSGRDRDAHARVSAAARRGEVDVLVGTHALLSEEIHFARLGLVIVDEQHRLGVAQRLALVGKAGAQASSPHLLTVSATPIPRTLALALRGELSAVHLDERPPGRRTPESELLPRSAWKKVVAELAGIVARGGSAFVVCSSIERPVDDEGAPDESASPGAVARAKELTKTLGAGNVALIHGNMDDDQRRAALASFRRGDVRVLVGTTMLEVGVDVPSAVLMVIDGADRFGLAQLHQLRGRVGRGTAPGRCLLVYGEPLTDLAKNRLSALATADDGLTVARADLRLRGAGDLEGARQSGEAAGFRFLDPLVDEPLILRAVEDVERLSLARGGLERADLGGLRRALARFDADAAARDLGLARGEAG